MDNNLLSSLRNIIKGDVEIDNQTLNLYSHDASLFEVKPQAVVFPKDIQDIKNLVKFVNQNKRLHSSLSLTARSAGTDMGGGSINDSIIVEFNKYFNHIKNVSGFSAVSQPGVLYKDFEKETLKYGLIFPSYPASKEICAIGGIVNNNSGGEKSLEYGKTEKYVEELKVILSDGNEYTLKPLNDKELQDKLTLNSFEGEIYRKIYKLITQNYDILQKAKPNVSKNSAGYYLWNVYDKEAKIFNLIKLFVGAQGTLGLVTQVKLKLVPVKKYSEMRIIFLNDLKHLGNIINAILPLEPESFETYDDHTLKLAIKFFPSFAKSLGTKGLLQTAWHFLPEFFMILTGGIPKLVLQVEFAGNSDKILKEKIKNLEEALKSFNLRARTARSKKEEKKYWVIRRESFNLLRRNIKDKHTAPFIDDFIVRPEYLQKFLPELNTVFSKYPDLIYTIAGHLGDGNFHIIPLMDIKDPRERAIIPLLADEVYDLVLKYNGSITAEHNDGLIRTPYLKKMYGEKVYDLFEQTKKIFDPHNIFNPRKKVGGDLDFAMNHIRQNW